jgi:hypothetical protein
MSSVENQTSTPIATDGQTRTPRKKNRIGTMLWTIVALFVAFLAAGVYTPQHSHLAISTFLTVWLGGAFLGLLGARIGNAILRIARPDVIVTSGGISDVLWVRICWSIGPQLVGLYLGAVSGTSILVGWVV